jgi:hypothetical protein
VLERGYSITTREEGGAALRDAASVAAGERLLTRLARGSVRSLVVGREAGGQGTLFEDGDPGIGNREPGKKQPGRE